MLAQNFKTPTELGLTEKQRQALILTLFMLEGDALKHRPFTANGPGFNMWSFGDPDKVSGECQTPGCIAGWSDALGGTNFTWMKNWPRELQRLFYPPLSLFWGAWIKPSWAARTLRGYLVTGQTRWFAIQ